MKVNVSSNAVSRQVLLAPTVSAPQTTTVTVEDHEGYDLKMIVTAEPMQGDKLGRFICSHLEVTQRPNGEPVTTAAIRSVAVRNIVSHAAVQVMMKYEGETSPGTYKVSMVVMPEGIGSNGPTDDALEWVAIIYQRALVLGQKPTVAVENSLQLTRATAGRWIKKAREKGFLGPSEGPGKAGG